MDVYHPCRLGESEPPRFSPGASLGFQPRLLPNLNNRSNVIGVSLFTPPPPKKKEKKMQADTSSTLGTIRRETSTSIVSTLLDLQEHGRYDDRTYDWIENLEVIYLNTSGGSRKRRRGDEVVARNCGKRLLWRRRVNAHYSSQKYIAVSYTWRPPPNQPSSHDAYLVQSREGSCANPNRVRDQVLDRVIAYAN